VAPEFGPPPAICRALEAHSLGRLGVDQLIHEFGSWVHIAWALEPRAMALNIDQAGSRLGFAYVNPTGMSLD
jgi:hypothetical protein